VGRDYTSPTVTSKYQGALGWCVARTVKVPDPVYERIQRKAEREDVSHGVVVRDWMDKAEKYDELEVRR